VSPTFVELLKVKVKVMCPCALAEHHAMKTYWGSGCIALRILLPWHYMEVSGQLHAPAALSPGNSPQYPLDRRLELLFQTSLSQVNM